MIRPVETAELSKIVRGVNQVGHQTTAGLFSGRNPPHVSDSSNWGDHFVRDLAVKVVCLAAFTVALRWAWRSYPRFLARANAPPDHAAETLRIFEANSGAPGFEQAFLRYSAGEKLLTPGWPDWWFGREFVEHLEACGVKFLSNGKVDLASVRLAVDIRQGIISTLTIGRRSLKFLELEHRLRGDPAFAPVLENVRRDMGTPIFQGPSILFYAREKEILELLLQGNT